MDITFFIGNGFDKALGLKTGYYDFYGWLKQQQPNDAYVTLMKRRIMGKRDLWSDFEKGIGSFTNHFIDEGDLPNDLPPWKTEIDTLLIKYLNSLNTSEKVKDILHSNENIQRCFDNINGAVLALKLLNPALFSQTDEKISIHIVSLNYTDSLDQLSDGMRHKRNSLFEIDSQVLHPHGSLSKGIILGVNDESQINNDSIRKDHIYSDIMVKSSQIKKKFPDEKAKALELINRSTIVCLYGVSLGETDNEWWNFLGNWLRTDEKNRLVVLWYCPDEQGDREQVRNIVRKAFLGRLQLTDDAKERLKKRIMVYFHKRKFIFGPPPKIVVPLGDGVEMSLLFVESGRFIMSKKDGENGGNEIEHEARLNNDFYIGETQVTQEQYSAVLGTNPSHFKGKKLPVEQVMWFDAMNFCAMLNEKELALPGYHFSLPTETQWEYAARGGNMSKGYKYSGSDNADEVAWYRDNSGNTTHEVKSKKNNELGLYDMSGNVWEWCLDDYVESSCDTTPEYIRENSENNSAKRMDRGGAYDCESKLTRVGCRNNYDSKGQRLSIGFRIALVPNQY